MNRKEVIAKRIQILSMITEEKKLPENIKEFVNKWMAELLDNPILDEDKSNISKKAIENYNKYMGL